MLALKWLLMVAGVALFGSAAGVVGYDVYLAMQFQKLMAAAKEGAGPLSGREARGTRPIRWSLAAKLFGYGCVPLLLAMSIALVPEGAGGIRVSQISGVQRRTLYPGVHPVIPFVQQLVVYDLRDQVFTTAAGSEPASKGAALTVQTREGLSVGLAVAVRYKLDPAKLAYIHANLAQPIDSEIVAPVVTSEFRDLAPNYVVREVYSTRRDEFHARAAQALTERLGEDGILVKEVLLRDVQLPPEYAKGLEGMLLKEQESERMEFETAIQEKQVKLAELQAEAQKAQQIKRSEADAASRVIAAKAESDAMQYTLPLKQKQIEESKLEAQARKEATVENAQAAAESKVIDSKAEVERRKLLAAADAETIRLTSAADAQRLQAEAVVLKENPLLIQKIVAERLSDKLQIIMVPATGSNFFASDVLRSAFAGHVAPNTAEPGTQDVQQQQEAQPSGETQALRAR